MRISSSLVSRAAMFGAAIAAVMLGSMAQSWACSAITSISPASGPSTGGTVVTITGNGFHCGVVFVKFGDKTASFTTDDFSLITDYGAPQHIFAIAPPGTAGTSVTVTVSLGLNGLHTFDSFTYTTPDDSSDAKSLQDSISTAVSTISGQVIGNAIDGGIGAGFSNGGTTSFGGNGGFINFAAEPKSEIANRTDEAFAALAYAGNNKAPSYNKAPPRLAREWSAWADIRGTGWNAKESSGTGNDLKGSQINLTVGLGRKLNADTLVGVVVGYENFKYDVAALSGSLKGDGETIGGYFSRRFGSNLRFDLALAWSNVNYDVTSGTATGSFTGSRWLATTGLTGNQKLGAFVLEPSAKVFMLWESQAEWTDSLLTRQAARDFSAGRAAFGSKVGYPYTLASGWTVSPFVGLYGDWRFSSDNALPTGTPVANIKDGWSGRATAGISAMTVRGTQVSLGGEYGGLGADYKIWSGNVRAVMPF